MPTNPIAVTSISQDASFTSPFIELEAREASIAKNLEGLDVSAMQQAIGEELIAIKERKLYRAAGIKSFKSYLDTRRNPMSRSRAYQLILFARERLKAAQVDTPVPANERQLRALNAKDHQADEFKTRWFRVYKYLDKKFLSFPVEERWRFAEGLRAKAMILGKRAQQGLKTQAAPKEGIDNALPDS